MCHERKFHIIGIMLPLLAVNAISPILLTSYRDAGVE